MYSLFLYTLFFSSAAIIGIGVWESKKRTSIDWIIRIALLSLLLFPAFLCLPKWHVLPAPSGLHALMETASQESPKWLIFLWGNGMLFCLIRISASIWQLQKWQKSSKPLTDSSLLLRLRHCCQKINYRGAIHLRETPSSFGPAAAGYFSAKIFLPLHWREWPESTLDAVLLHEISHHAHRDPLWRLLNLCSSSLHWYNPLVIWLSRKWVDQSEYRCDRLVVKGGISKQTYANILCDLASSAPYSAMAMATPSSLEKRVRRLGEKSDSSSDFWIYLACGILILGALAVATLRPAEDPSETLPPTQEDTQIRIEANPFPDDAADDQP